MKQFIWHLLKIVPILLVVGLVNFIVDPAHLFRSYYEEQIVDYMIDGKNVTNVSNCDDRRLQVELIKRMPACPDEIVLGASKVQLINSQYKTTSKLVNHGVAGGTLEDFIAIYELYEEKGCKIKKVLIGVEPYLLNDNHNQKRWKRMAAAYFQMCEKIGKPQSQKLLAQASSSFDKYSQLFSFSYFQSSVEFLRAKKHQPIKPTDKNVNKDFTKLSDGSIMYDEAYRTGRRRKNMNLFRLSYSIENFNNISDKYYQLLVAFISYLKQQKIEVEFYLGPIHPTLYEHILTTEKYKLVPLTEELYLNLASKENIKVYGSFDPKKYNLTEKDFYDLFHCNAATVEMIMKERLRPNPEVDHLLQ
jgi:hypothetical protein